MNLAPDTSGAGTARWGPRKNNGVSLFQCGYAVSNRFNGARSLVAKNNRKLDCFFSFQGAQITAANAAGRYLDPDFSFLWVTQFHFFNYKWPVAVMRDSGLSFHRDSSLGF
jgi:hypothetical protein